MNNLLELLRNIFSGREKCDMMMSQWKSQNEAVYNDFSRRIDAISKGDYSVVSEIFQLMKECVPQEVLDFYTWLGKLFTGKVKPEDIESDLQRFEDKFSEIAVQADDMMLEEDPEPSEVELYEKLGDEVIKIIDKSPDEIWKQLPVAFRAYLVSNVNDVLRFIFKNRLKQTNLTKIYKGTTYFLYLFVLMNATFAGLCMVNLYNIVIERKEPLAYCLYYFVMFDHGFRRMAQVLNDILCNENIDSDDLFLISTCIGSLTSESTRLGAETKEGWKATADRCLPEIGTQIIAALKSAKQNRGNKKKIAPLDSMLIGDVDKLKKQIKKFMEENPKTISLAYLLESLRRAKRIKDGARYMTFHCAIEHFTGKRIGYDVPQKRFGELKAMSLEEAQHGKSFTKAKETIDKWTKIFATCA